MQLPALPIKDTFTGRGTPLQKEDMKKVPAALAGRRMDIRSHLCRGTRDICVPCDQVTHANPKLDLSHPRPYGRGESETPKREKKTGGKDYNPSLQRGFLILIIGISVGLGSFETSYLAILNIVFIKMSPLHTNF
jgi:hypothetical protein